MVDNSTHGKVSPPAEGSTARRSTRGKKRHSNPPLLTRGALLGLRLQAIVAGAFMPLLYPVYNVLFRVVLRYRVPGWRAKQAEIRESVGRGKRPLLICPNHLTMIDSMILIWILNPWWRTFWDTRFFSWNIPEKTNYSHIPLLRFFTYVGRCIEIVREGSKEKTRTLLAKLHVLLMQGQSIMIFPEGKRSRDGRVDTRDFTYGTGRIIEELRACNMNPLVLCLYLRGRHQKLYGTIPKRNESFYLDYSVIEPESSHKGLRAHRDISTQIVNKLAELEQHYFAGTSFSR